MDGCCSEVDCECFGGAVGSEDKDIFVCEWMMGEWFLLRSRCRLKR